MANRNLQSHCKSDKIKWVLSGIAFVLVFAILIGMCLQIFGTGKVKPSEWFKKETEKVEEVADDGGMEISDDENHGISIVRTAIPVSQFAEYGISPIAESAVQLVASIEPADATYTGLTWSVDFVDKSGWAADKTATDYVSLDSYKTGGQYGQINQRVTVSCLQAFAKQIQIKVVSDDNPAYSGVCTVDYVSRLTNLELSLNDRDGRDIISAGNKIVVPEDLLDDTSNMIWYSATLSPIFSDGTIRVDNHYWTIVEWNVYCPGDEYSGVETYPTRNIQAHFNEPMTALSSVTSDSFTDLFGFEIYSGYEANARRIYENPPTINIDIKVKGQKEQNGEQTFHYSYATDWKAALYKSVSNVSLGFDSYEF